MAKIELTESEVMSLINKSRYDIESVVNSCHFDLDPNRYEPVADFLVKEAALLKKLEDIMPPRKKRK